MAKQKLKTYYFFRISESSEIEIREFLAYSPSNAWGHLRDNIDSNENDPAAEGDFTLVTGSVVLPEPGLQIILKIPAPKITGLKVISRKTITATIMNNKARSMSKSK